MSVVSRLSKLSILFIVLLSSPLSAQTKLSLNTHSKQETTLSFHKRSELTYKGSGSLTPGQSYLKPLSLQREQVNILGIFFSLIYLPNPQLVYDNKEIYFGITKQLSFMLYRADFGVGRLGFEYSYVFSKEHPNHFRGSYIQDIPLVTSDFSVLLFSFEGGYFTDLDKRGISGSAAINTLLGFNSFLYVNPYLKLRHTFMLQDRSDITDLSLGVGIGFYFLY